MKHLVLIIIAVLFQYNSLLSQHSDLVVPDSMRGYFNKLKVFEKSDKKYYYTIEFISEDSNKLIPCEGIIFDTNKIIVQKEYLSLIKSQGRSKLIIKYDTNTLEINIQVSLMSFVEHDKFYITFRSEDIKQDSFFLEYPWKNKENEYIKYLEFLKRYSY